MAKIAVAQIIVATLVVIVFPAKARAQFTYGHYQHSATTLDITPVKFKSGEDLKLIMPDNPWPASCTGHWTYEFHYDVNRTYNGQSITQDSSAGSGSLFCSGSTINLHGSLPSLSASFVENGTKQIIVIGGILSGTYIPNSSTVSKEIDVPVSFFDWDAIIKYTVKNPGKPKRTVVGPLRGVLSQIGR